MEPALGLSRDWLRLCRLGVAGADGGRRVHGGLASEKSLSVDNLFVFALIFAYFKVPREYQHRVLFYGVIGALVFRGVFIAAGVASSAVHRWIIFVFGAILIYSAIKLIKDDDETIDPGKSLRGPTAPQDRPGLGRVPRHQVLLQAGR